MWDLLKEPFFYNILWMILLGSVLATIAGLLMDINDFGGISGGMTHGILGGVGVSGFIGFSSFWGALISIIIIAYLLSRQYIKDKTKIAMLSNIIWGGGMSIGIIFMSLTPGYQASLSNFLFGNLALVNGEDVLQALWLDVIILLFTGMFFRQIVLLAISVHFARLQKIYINFLTFFVLALIGIAVVNLVKTVGIALALLLFIVPIDIAKNMTSGLKRILIVAMLVSVVSMITGLFLSYWYALPIGAITGLLLLMGLGVARCIARIKGRETV